MIKFLLNGILRDKSRSVLPVIIVSIGVMLTVLLSGYMAGVFGDVVTQSAKFDTGHVKIMSKAYAENIDQLPNDLALLGINEVIAPLQEAYPDMDWVKRIKFGGLLDVLDEEGESKGQGPVTGMSFEIYSGNDSELKRMNFEDALVEGSIPAAKNEALLGVKFADQLGLKLGDEMTFIGSTMNGSMAFTVFKLVGTVRFGTAVMDEGAMIIDVADAQHLLDMENGTSEILGYLDNDVYDEEATLEISKVFNARYADSKDEFAPIMIPLKKQGELEELITLADSMSALLIAIFIFAMSIVLWNTGLLAGLRRYKEFGIRLSLGETKGHIYKTFIGEAILIGIIGSIIGTIIGLIGIYYLQEVGIDISSMMDQIDAGFMMPSVMRGKVTPNLFYIGFIPGLFAMVLGNMLSGMGIYKRQTASLMKELEV
ncbi:ABC transporter permease [Portibacter lacus]|uniref:ABC3 transporter permease protein domain-containing protein n=1 Tax=Portibacter lacus TaxID=1099794 RepID=A0AA37WG47_9BACT|nr:FtsX-like permease family protein [Portibacter lacus]GLR19483.1 hypothetical protein GCM10007940_40990 [Portibacter lacus]